MAKRYFEYKDAKSKKFWEVSVSGKKVNIRYGKIGTDGQTSLKELGTPAEAKAHAEKQAAGKVKKGYKEAAKKAVKRCGMMESFLPLILAAVRSAYFLSELEIALGVYISFHTRKRVCTPRKSPYQDQPLLIRQR